MRKALFWLLPWLIAAGLGYIIYLNWDDMTGASSPIEESELHQSILLQTESLGKLELVKHHFQEVTEVQKMGKDFYDLFKLESDSRAILISKGEAVGCIDLQKMTREDITLENDTVWVQLPYPEICYFKLDLENTKIYSLETGFLTNQEKFISEAYRKAEMQIQNSALMSGILKETEKNAGLMLKPLFEQISGRPVVIRSSLGLLNKNTLRKK